MAPRPLHTREAAPVILLLKWPLEAELGAISTKILVETAPTFDGLDSLCKAALKGISLELFQKAQKSLTRGSYVF